MGSIQSLAVDQLTVFPDPRKPVSTVTGILVAILRFAIVIVV